MIEPGTRVMFVADDPMALWRAGDCATVLGYEPEIPLQMNLVLDGPSAEMISLYNPLYRGLLVQLLEET
jgi:hypothetical protein